MQQSESLSVELGAARTAGPSPAALELLPPREKVSSAAFRQLITTIIVFGPLLAVAVVIAQAVGGTIPSIPVLLLAVGFYFVVGHGVTIGFHRLFTHRGFHARRPLKVTLAVFGSMAFQGSIIGWVAEHRRHHQFTDQPGDPHSPDRPETQRFGRVRGLFHAHLGWFYEKQHTSRERFAPDLLADPDIVLVDKLFVPLSMVTLALPFALGFAITGTLGGALAAFLWAGVLRVALLHHVTWSTNSVCHVFGKRPFRTSDTSTNFAPLAVLSMGEAYHNAHHAFPAMARHGCDRFQLDSSALLIRLFERFGWATKVRWPDPARLDSRRQLGPVMVDARGRR
jgi:stearoyl-CoA desaturase (Delta-9 desaturase)